MEVFEWLAVRIGAVGFVVWLACTMTLAVMDKTLPHSDEEWAALFLRSRFWFGAANLCKQFGTSPQAVKRTVEAWLGEAPSWIVMAILRKAGR